MLPRKKPRPGYPSHLRMNYPPPPLFPHLCRFTQGMMGLVAKMPVYVSGVDRNETFGLNNTGLTRNSTLCPGCYNETTHTIFWVGDCR